MRLRLQLLRRSRYERKPHVVDHMPTMPTGESAVPGVDNAAPKAGLLSSARGRVTIIVAAIALFVVIAGAAAYAVWLFLGQAVDEAEVQLETALQTQSESVTQVEDVKVVPTEPDPVNLKSVFAIPRNIFLPLAEAPDEDEETTATADGTASSTTSVSSGTLYLRGITAFADGHFEIDAVYGDTSYSLEEGERIPNTPWQVLSIGADSVVMLFGDTQVTLTAGQSVTK